MKKFILMDQKMVKKLLQLPSLTENHINYPYLITLLSFYAELKAIDLALNHIEQDAYWRYIIFTDSLSAMQALKGEKTDNPLVVKLLEKLSRLCERADIVFCWLPSHIGINGNEEADKAAKDALSLEILPFKVPCSDFKPLINSFIHEVCQKSWSDPLNQENKIIRY